MGLNGACGVNLHKGGLASVPTHGFSLNFA